MPIVTALLLDIEGTTTPLDFVHRTLFPYARAHMRDFVTGTLDTAGMQTDLALLWREYGGETPSPDTATLPSWQSPASRAGAMAYLEWLMDRDRKSRALKSLQGRIWQAGYETGEIIAQVYTDVAETLRLWRDAGGRTYIFSSGSILAQELLFRYSDQGDLTPLLDGYFDTAIGPKRAADSYASIVKAIAVPAPRVLFVSDVIEELDAAQAAGLCGALAVRPGNPPIPETRYPIITDFGQLVTPYA